MIRTGLYALILFAITALHADTSLEVSQGYRRDRLDIRSHRKTDGGKLHIKHKFHDIDIYSSRLALSLSQEEYFLKAATRYGQVVDGRFHGEAHRDGEGVHHAYHYKEQFHGKAHIRGEYTVDATVSLGKNIPLDDGWTIAPTIGYGYSFQKYHTNKGHFTHEQKLQHHKTHIASHKVHGHFSREHIKARWYSPQIGVRGEKACTESLKAYLQYDLLYPLIYRANVSHLEHKQKNTAWLSFGNTGTLGVDWNFAPGWHLAPECEAMALFAHGSHVQDHIKFKRAYLTSIEARLTLEYRF